MVFPNITDYKAALEIGPDTFATLNTLEPARDAKGEIFFSSGSFAVVFRMRDTATGKLHALRCFTRRKEGLEDTYRLISDCAAQHAHPSLVPFRFLPDEMWVETSLTDRREFPALLMDWAGGESMEAAVKRLCAAADRGGLLDLAAKFELLALWLLERPFAHGDLKHNNLMLGSAGQLCMIDYDGMFAPGMEGRPAPESGTASYSHPRRAPANFNADMDDFSIVVIALSLRLLAAEPALLARHNNGENLVFSPSDFENPSQSALWADLWPLAAAGNAAVTAFAGVLQMALAGGAGKVLPLRAVLEGVKKTLAATVVLKTEELSVQAKPIKDYRDASGNWDLTSIPPPTNRGIDWFTDTNVWHMPHAIFCGFEIREFPRISVPIITLAFGTDPEIIRRSMIRGEDGSKKYVWKPMIAYGGMVLRISGNDEIEAFEASLSSEIFTEFIEKDWLEDLLRMRNPFSGGPYKPTSVAVRSYLAGYPKTQLFVQMIDFAKSNSCELRMPLLRTHEGAFIILRRSWSLHT